MENYITVKNGWYEIDDLFCGKKISDKKYQFISAEWLDTCGDDERAENAIDDSDNYVVCADIIDLDDEDMAGFDNIVANCDNFEEYLAEYLYQKKSISDCNTISNVVSKADALRIIQNFIDNH